MWPKLDGLERLVKIGTDAFAVPQFVAFTVSQWRADPAAAVRFIADAGLGPTLAVRSCAAMEDDSASEPPGFFESVLGVAATNPRSLADAIELVCQSYRRRSTPPAATDDKVLVQTQLLDPWRSGVCRIEDGEGDFLEVEYDESLSRTDAVTAGLNARRIHLSPHLEDLPFPWRSLRAAMNVVRVYIGAPVFVEFAIDRAGAPWIFQVRIDRRPRPLAMDRAPTREELEVAAATVASAGPLSVMADWNPAEMLGRNPGLLDISLYDELLMSGAWALGRASLGWRSPTQRKLMVQVGGRPYVRLKTSLETLLPRGIPKRLADDLVADRLRLLQREPDLHDKIEFRLVWSAYAFDDESVSVELRRRGFDNGQIRTLFQALRKVTHSTVGQAAGLLREDRAGVKEMRSSRKRLARIDAKVSPAEVSGEIRAALDACRIYGTTPFSRQARVAFSFRYIIDYLTGTDPRLLPAVQAWEAGLNTVTRQLSQAVGSVSDGSMSASQFNRRFGHLRPRTYNIESARYDERPVIVAPPPSQQARRSRVPPDTACLESVLRRNGITISQRDFWKAAGGAFRAREELKFCFSALLSDVLLILARVASWSQVERATLRTLRIQDILRVMDRSKDWSVFARLALDKTRQRTPLLRWPLPDILWDRTSLHAAEELSAKPTFIGTRVAYGPARAINGDGAPTSQLGDAIVAIDAPDPGFDWIFSQPLKGLITEYGGQFSHMGIRCAEFGISAALGCGTRTFDTAAGSAHITIDPSGGEIWADGLRLYPP